MSFTLLSLFAAVWYLKSLKPVKGADRSLRRRLTLKGDFMLALLPMAVVLGIFALVEVFSNQRLLFLLRLL